MKFDDIKKLHQKKYREEFRHFLVEGEHLVLELQKAAVNESAAAGKQAVRDQRARTLAQPVRNACGQQPPHGGDGGDENAAGNHCTRADAAQRPLHAKGSAPSISTKSRTRAISARYCAHSPGSEISAACSAPAASIPTTRKSCAPEWARIFHVPIELDVPLDSLRGRVRAHRLSGYAGRTAAVPEFQNVRLLCVRQRSARRSPRADAPHSKQSRFPSRAAAQSSH